jgi:hypothetical protein
VKVGAPKLDDKLAGEILAAVDAGFDAQAELIVGFRTR